MGYTALYTSDDESIAVFKHRKAALLADNSDLMYAITENKDRAAQRDIVSMLSDKEGRAALNGVFTAFARAEHDGKGMLGLLNVKTAETPKNFTGQTYAAGHLHAIGTEFNAQHGFIADSARKTYVAAPNPNLQADIKASILFEEDGLEVVHFGRVSGGEAVNHDVLVYAGFEDSLDFFENATDEQKNALYDAVETFCARAALEGGARLIIDERNLKVGAFTLQLVSGEVLHPSGVEGTKWFEEGDAPAAPIL